MGPEHFGGEGTWIFPGLICIIMMVVGYFVFVRSGIRPPWSCGGGTNQTRDAGSELALEILEKRYARGEITLRGTGAHEKEHSELRDENPCPGILMGERFLFWAGTRKKNCITEESAPIFGVHCQADAECMHLTNEV